MGIESSDRSGRRERNKLEKRARIASAAAKLISERGISEITTLQVAEVADVASGTVFLYAKTKGELLLLAQNSKYSRALEAGKTASAAAAQSLAHLVSAAALLVMSSPANLELSLDKLTEQFADQLRTLLNQ